MRLIELSANKESFKPLRFNRTGISLILAEQRESSDDKKTYNGVGKTLSFAILHYCLGSNKIAAFEEKLAGWEFSLLVEIGEEEHRLTRAAGDSNRIFLDESPVSLRDLKSFLTEAALKYEPSVPGITFRSLVPRFLRYGRGAYDDFMFASRKEVRNPYQPMLRSAFLLGLDLELAKEKQTLRERQQSLKTTMKQLKKDPLFRELLEDDSVDIELLALHQQARELREDLAGFVVAEDYHEIEQEANNIKRELDLLRRDAIKTEEAIEQINRSLERKGDLAPERVFKLYAEVERVLPDLVKETVENVLSFHDELQNKRGARLSADKQRLRRNLEGLRVRVAEMSELLNEKMAYLKSHRALDEYVAVNEKLGDLRRRIAKLENSKSLREDVDHELKKLEVALAEEVLRTDEYLNDSAGIIEEASLMFRGFASELYGTRPSGLTVKNDEGKNTTRYRIEARIRADAAEGINEAKIFCFDMVVLALQRGHNFKFQGHDSTLFGPVDPRQRLGMFKIANRVAREQDLQYIAALNLHDVTSIREQVSVSEETLGELFGDSVIVHLADDSAESRLLGIDVDLNYLK